MIRTLNLAVMTLGAFVYAGAALAAEAPQFRGPERDGHYLDTGLLKSWPEGGPTLAWKMDGVGKGYSSVAVANGTVYTAGMLDDNQGYVFALNEDGTLKWKSAYGPETQEKMATGSRSTPTIDGDRLYLQSGLGAVICMSTADGKVLWTVDAAKQFQAQEVLWVFSESLLVDGDRVFVTPGGKEAAIVALNKMTGETIWVSKGLSEASAYCSPAIFTLGGKRTLVQWLAESMVGLDPATGEVFWTHHQKVPYDIHANTPVGKDNQLYYSAESGGGVIEIGPDGKTVTQKWTSEAPQILHHGVILHEGYLYGAGFRNDRKLYCLEFATGKEMWSTDEIEEGSIILADGMLYIYESPKKGIVSLVKATPEKYERTGSFTIPSTRDKHWAHPAVVNGLLYIRYDGTLYAYSVAAK